jgi:hypothetical protein
MVEIGAQAVSAGRPRCDLCDFPMDPDGHICPRWNWTRRVMAAQSGWPQQSAIPDDAAHVLLRTGEIEILGRMPWSSNATYLATVSVDDVQMLTVYKPQRGERPLWDFPRGTLCNREYAAYLVSSALGWDLVPDTVLRDGPAGHGMLQRFVDHDPEDHYFTLLERHADEFRRMAALDIVINNTDRKGGHCLRATTTGRVFGIDHGVSFHAQWKVRTVIWDFAGEPLRAELCRDLHGLLVQLNGDLGAQLEPLLDRFERDALRARTEHLVASGTYPETDGDYHNFPWPLV